MPSTMSEYQEKKERMISYLGGYCKECGTTDHLQIDHVDHTQKSFTVTENWGRSWSILQPELDKCQLLCKTCHLKKSIAEGSLAKGWSNQPRIKHGTTWTYNKHKCRCDLCTEAKKASYKK